MEAFLGKLLVMAGSTVDVIPFGQEALRADRLLALEAGEAFLVPHFVLVLHVLRSCNAHTDKRSSNLSSSGRIFKIKFSMQNPPGMTTL